MVLATLLGRGLRTLVVWASAMFASAGLSGWTGLPVHREWWSL